ncbi:MAG: hypothetical protein CM15mP68_1460 [Pseudomonadota bacterium]|nr:MAG: hypothetical protein CM15mP68_1460 [Pseudomonadota bacterium]
MWYDSCGDEALRLAITTFVDPGAAFASADPSYSLYPVFGTSTGRSIVSIELNGTGHCRTLRPGERSKRTTHLPG